jgi:methylated-DNA-[protein]-cysteine S-methyltransferase
MRATEFATQFGRLSAVVDGDVVIAAGFTGVPELLARLGGIPAALEGEVPSAVSEAVRGYCDGDVAALDVVEVRQPGGPFQQAAWVALRQIPAGQTRTYAELAHAAGNPAAVRAAGQACARNLVAPFVPCHRVVRTGGDLGGYAYGVSIKEALLRHEHKTGAA